MLPGLSIVARAVSAVTMIAALFFLTTANFWVYGIQKQKQATAAAASTTGEEDSTPSVPNPVEEKNANNLQNLSEYLHEADHVFLHPVSIASFGNRHDIINLPIHHPELLTPPPKPVV